MKAIKQVLLSCVLGLTMVEPSLAQTFSNNPKDTIISVGMMNDFEQLIIQQLNTSADTITLQWEKISENIPMGWQASVCDNKICYSTLVDSGIMNPIVPSATGFLLMDITPNKNYGTAVIRYSIWDVSNPTFKDTLTYIHTVNTLGITQMENKNAFHVFPNPITDKIIIHTTRQTNFVFSMIDMSGKVIKLGILNNEITLVPVDDLPNGLYFFQVKSEHKMYSQKFIKQ
jgi:hypothetical protein